MELGHDNEEEIPMGQRLDTTTRGPKVDVEHLEQLVLPAQGPLRTCDADALEAEQAYYRLTKVSQKTGDREILELCRHHYNDHRFALEFDGWIVLEDNIADLLPAPWTDLDEVTPVPSHPGGYGRSH